MLASPCGLTDTQDFAKKKKEGGSGQEVKSAKGVDKTHVLQILHNVKEPLGLLVRIAHLLNGLAAHQVLGDLGPHVARGKRRGRGLGLARAAVNVDVDVDLAVAVVDGDAGVVPADDGDGRRPGRRRARHGDELPVALGDKGRPAHAAVLGPVGLGAGAAHAVHAHPLGAGGHVDNGPVLGVAVPRLAHAAAGVDPARHVLGLLVDGGRHRRGGPGAAVRAAPVVDAEAVHAVADNEFVVVVVRAPLVAAAAVTAGGAVDVDVDLGLVFGEGDVDVGLAFAVGVRPW